MVCSLCLIRGNWIYFAEFVCMGLIKYSLPSLASVVPGVFALFGFWCICGLFGLRGLLCLLGLFGTRHPALGTRHPAVVGCGGRPRSM